jgi:D-xylose transport system substrate-binding protein
MKKVHLRALAAVASAILAVAAAGGCASSDDPAAGSTGDTAKAKIAFLMPDIASTRYELFDAPLFKAKIEALCPDCEVLYQNADADASKQQQQANSVLARA